MILILFNSRGEEQDLPGVVSDTIGFTHFLHSPHICKAVVTHSNHKPPEGVAGDTVHKYL